MFGETVGVADADRDTSAFDASRHAAPRDVHFIYIYIYIYICVCVCIYILYIYAERDTSAFDASRHAVPGGRI